MTKADQVRLTTWRFKVLRQAEESARSVARTCRHFGISRKTFYKWKRRFADHGEAGLCDHARTPHRSPRATPPEVVSKMLYCCRRRFPALGALPLGCRQHDGDARQRHQRKGPTRVRSWGRTYRSSVD